MPAMTLEILAQKLEQRYGDLIRLAPNQTYTRMIDPLVFVDRDYGEWSTSPNNVINKGCTHPHRKAEKRRQTVRQKYGVDNVFQAAKIKDKIQKSLLTKYGVEHPSKSALSMTKRRQTNLQKYGVDEVFKNTEVRRKIRDKLQELYGVDHPVHNDDIADKIKTTLKKKYGVDNPSKNSFILQARIDTNRRKYSGPAPACSEAIRNKIKETNLKVYGSANAALNPDVQDKIKETCLERFGVDTVFKNVEVQAKVRDTLLRKYGVNSGAKITAHKLPNGLILSEYMDQFDCRLNYTSLMTVYQKFGFEVLKEYVELGKVFDYSTSLERKASQILNLPVYRKSLPGLRRRPDFKIADAVYLDVDGLYFHSSAVKKDCWYHFNKRKQYEDARLKIFQIREHEIVQEQLFRYLGQEPKIIDATSCISGDISVSDGVKFFSENSFEKACGLNFRGLFFEGQLFCMISQRGEQVNFCNRRGYWVEGGMSKLLGKQDYWSSCNLRFGYGEEYVSSGFKFVADKLSWEWTDFYRAYPKKRNQTVKIFNAGIRFFRK